MKMTLRRRDDAPDGNDRLKELATPLNLHYAGLAVLGLVCLYLLAQVGFAWRATSAQSADALAQQTVELKTAEIQARPLQGLDAKLATAKVESDAFYRKRLPVSYSDVLAQLGVLSKANAIRLNGVQYSQAPVLADDDGALTQVKMDASLTGEYRGLVEFVNGLERDKVFFVVNGVTLTGQESGRVNLRIKLTTYLRGLSSDEEAARYSTTPSDADQMSAQAAAMQGGQR